MVINSHRVLASSNEKGALKRQEEANDYQVTTFTENDAAEMAPAPKANRGKENVYHRPARNSKESITKLDLSKLKPHKEAQPSTYSGHRSVFEQINYDKREKEAERALRREHDSTTMADVSSSVYPMHSQHSHDFKQLGAKRHDLSLFNEGEADSSIMNLSELIVQSNPALKSILQMAASQDLHD